MDIVGESAAHAALEHLQQLDGKALDIVQKPLPEITATQSKSPSNQDSSVGEAKKTGSNVTNDNPDDQMETDASSTEEGGCFLLQPWEKFLFETTVPSASGRVDVELEEEAGFRTRTTFFSVVSAFTYRMAHELLLFSPSCIN